MLWAGTCRQPQISSTGTTSEDTQKRPEDTSSCPAQSSLLALSIIQKDKVSDTWESNAVCFPLLSQYFDSKCEGGRVPGGPRHVKCSFMFHKGTTSSSISHPWNGELRGRSHSAGRLCSDRLANLTTDWLWKWLSFVPLAPSSPSSPSEASVALSFFFSLCASTPPSLYSYSLSPPTAKDRSVREVIKVIRTREEHTRRRWELQRWRGQE